MAWYWLVIVAGILAILLPLRVWAQEATPTPPPDDAPSGAPIIPLVHTVQEGENLTFIANSYGVTVEALLAVNNLSNADALSIGQELLIPGGEGEAVVTAHTVQAGDTLAHIAALFNTTPDEIMATNRLLNRMASLAIGQPLTVVSRTGSAQPQPVTGTPHVVATGESLLTIAAQYRLSPAEIAFANGLVYPYYLFPGQRLRIPGTAVYHDLPGEWVQVRVRPLSLQQGSTVSIYVQNLLDGAPSGSLAGQPLRFFPYEQGYVALAGIDAFTEPGRYTLQLAGSGNRPWTPFQQEIPIASSGFGVQQIVVSEELNALLDPQVRQQEDIFLDAIYNQTADSPAWDGLFQFPVTTPVVTAGYGDGRSYNGGPIEIFHTGVDFAGGIGTPILAPANGVVVFAAPLQLRGNTVILDHGLGVMTAYFHLSEMFVTPGTAVTTGQPIGAGGSTGLSTGPHLHWDVRVNGVPVNPVQWVEMGFP
ncbi:MAG: LysM peptidoglycan-binding domain-containing protein [Chloroflexi bacterium]|nr:LysM peptidoglycan-binding domain-containing protein [Ardenticatenaceae bacterium]NOG35800.1 LysM peptidoglycan-binding domain-containing protein [Chloroflexota bacterium]GIK57896.1 MAG: peptidase M23 [Chloroflexota bacterium]